MGIHGPQPPQPIDPRWGGLLGREGADPAGTDHNARVMWQCPSLVQEYAGARPGVDSLPGRFATRGSGHSNLWGAVLAGGAQRPWQRWKQRIGIPCRNG